MTKLPSNYLAARHPHVVDECGEELDTAFRLLVEAYESGAKLLLCGNGGSAADCDHIVGELMKGFLRARPLPKTNRDALRGVDGERGERVGARLQGALAAIALPAHTALSTAVGNDNGDGMAFAQGVYGLGNPGDVLLGISTSGNAENVLNAFCVARLRGMKTIALTGRAGGKLAPLADVAIQVPADATHEVQELHLPVYHALCMALEAYFFPE